MKGLRPRMACVGLVCAVGGYTIIRSKGGSDENKTAQPPVTTPAATATPTPAATATAPAAMPEAPKVAQADTTKPTENSAAATTATGDKPATATPATTPNPAKPEKEPTAAVEKPAGLSVPISSDPAGASVTVDGKPVEGQTPTTLPSLDGKKVYEVKLTMKGFHDWKVKLKPKAGDCCVFCSYGSVPCPPIQESRSCCHN